VPIVTKRLAPSSTGSSSLLSGQRSGKRANVRPPLLGWPARTVRSANSRRHWTRSMTKPLRPTRSGFGGIANASRSPTAVAITRVIPANLAWLAPHMDEYHTHPQATFLHSQVRHGDNEAQDQA
jgi:hypothetical protein